VLLLAGLPVAAARSEIVDKGPDDLRASASHIVVGTTRAVYSFHVQDDEWDTSYAVAEIAVGKVEKGQGLRPGGLVYARSWHRRWISKKPPRPNTNGHRGMPGRGNTVRVYLKRTQDGGYDVLFPNGAEILKPARAK
jgi:hypothetical protein